MPVQTICTMLQKIKKKKKIQTNKLVLHLKEKFALWDIYLFSFTGVLYDCNVA